jgi:Flp pilus assembly pilin Flp
VEVGIPSEVSAPYLWGTGQKRRLSWRREVKMFLEVYAKGKTLLWGLRDKVVREDGAVATEYGLLLFLIAVAIVVAVGALGASLVAVFQSADASLP